MGKLRHRARLWLPPSPSINPLFQLCVSFAKPFCNSVAWENGLILCTSNGKCLLLNLRCSPVWPIVSSPPLALAPNQRCNNSQEPKKEIRGLSLYCLLDHSSAWRDNWDQCLCPPGQRKSSSQHASLATLAPVFQLNIRPDFKGVPC